MQQIIEYQNGNVLSYAEFGDRKGYPILIQHGLIANISEYHWFARLIEAGNMPNYRTPNTILISSTQFAV